FAVRAAVDQIAHAEQAIDRRVEVHRLQALLQAAEMAVDIAHGQVAPQGVGLQLPKAAHYAVPLLSRHAQNRACLDAPCTSRSAGGWLIPSAYRAFIDLTSVLVLAKPAVVC